MTIPAHKSAGDTGHVTDHNSIDDVLTNHDGRISTNETNISSHGTTISNHESRISTNETNISALQSAGSGLTIPVNGMLTIVSGLSFMWPGGRYVPTGHYRVFGWIDGSSQTTFSVSFWANAGSYHFDWEVMQRATGCTGYKVLIDGVAETASGGADAVYAGHASSDNYTTEFGKGVNGNGQHSLTSGTHTIEFSITNTTGGTGLYIGDVIMSRYS